VEVRCGYERGVGALFVAAGKWKGHQKQDRGEMVWPEGMG